MKRKSKIIKYFILVIILILVSFDSVQTKSYLINIVANTSDISRNVGESGFFNPITAVNESDYLISGETGRVSDPTTVCSSNNQISILWQEGENSLLISKFTSNLSQITVQHLVLNSRLLTNDEHELSQPKLLIDSADNLHLFWYIMGFDTPQQGDIYYQKIDSEFNSIISPKIIHTYTHSGHGSSCFETIFKTLLLDETDSIHLLVDDNSYYILNDVGEIKASTVIPVELGTVQDLSLDSEGDALILCGDDDFESISSVKYTIGATNITEQSRNLLFSTTEKIVYYTRIQKVENMSYFFWQWKDKITYIEYYESFLFNSDGSLGDSGTLNEHFFTDSTVCLNSTHSASLSTSQGIYAPAEIYYSFFSPTQNQSHMETKLLIRFLKNEAYLWGPYTFDHKILLDMETEMIISWYVNDGQNGFQIFLWKIDYFGIETAPLVVVAPEEQNLTTVYSEIISLPRLPLLTLFLTISIIIPILLNRKRNKISEKK
ncbi:MAG: hypothetical protein ACTSQK_11470 [Candidatus Heimdallarchaeota archaeon]